MTKRGASMPEAFQVKEILTFPNVFMASVIRCATSRLEDVADQVVINFGAAVLKGEY